MTKGTLYTFRDFVLKQKEWRWWVYKDGLFVSLVGFILLRRVARLSVRFMNEVKDEVQMKYKNVLFLRFTLL